MHFIFYYVIAYLLLGAIGMYAANKKVPQNIKRHRWLKYISYSIITGLVIAGIFLHVFKFIAIAIIAAGSFEIIKANFFGRDIRASAKIISLIIYFLIALGFWKFSSTFTDSFLLFIYFQVLVFDAFCQITGQLVGKHKLAPKISEAKTVEGLAGGWIFCIVSALLAASWINATLLTGALFGLITGLTSFAGDMLGSYFKRLLNIKDFSNLLPEQGGFLDRFGSLMVTGAAYYVFSITCKNLL